MDERQIKVGDRVFVRAWYNRMSGRQGTVIRIKDDPTASEPIMVRFRDTREWFCSRNELELQR
jgi:hypothetical protein